MMKGHSHGHHGKCYGSTSMGERGQIVIPAEARTELDIQPGEKLIVFGKRNTVILIKSDIVARFAEKFMEKANLIEELLGFKKKSSAKQDKQDEKQDKQDEKQDKQDEKQDKQDEKQDKQDEENTDVDEGNKDGKVE